MKNLYKCELCDRIYNTKKEAYQCEKNCCNVEEIANLKYFIIKYTYPRLKKMIWYSDYLVEERKRLLYLMEEYLYNDDRLYEKEDNENNEMFKLYGILLPYMWN